MNFKEAGHYANHLSSLIGVIQNVMTSSSNLYKVTEVHKRNKFNQEAADETIEVQQQRSYNGQANDLAHLLVKLLNEKLMLAMAMEDAKQYTVLSRKENGKYLTLDAAIEFNKRCRQLANSYLHSLITLKPSERTQAANAYKFNAEGNQVTYRYEVDVKTELFYDKEVIRKLYKELLAKTDEISTQIDEAMLKDVVAFKPAYDIHDSVDDVIEKYLESRSQQNNG